MGRVVSWVKCKAADFLFLVVTTPAPWLYENHFKVYHAHHLLCFWFLAVSLVVPRHVLGRCYNCTTINGYAPDVRLTDHKNLLC